MGGYLTSHVLDLVAGKPAARVHIELWRLDPANGANTLLASAWTNADGRTDAPLLEGSDFIVGRYELVFDVGAYFAGQGIEAATPFLDKVPIHFGVANADAHYHVP